MIIEILNNCEIAFRCESMEEFDLTVSFLANVHKGFIVNSDIMPPTVYILSDKQYKSEEVERIVMG